MEDIRIGRRTLTSLTPKLVGAAATQICSGNLKRTVLTISPPTANTLTIAPNKDVAVQGGVAMVVNQPPFVMRIEEYGSLVQAAWFGIMSTGSNTIAVIEGILADE